MVDSFRFLWASEETSSTSICTNCCVVPVQPIIKGQGINKVHAHVHIGICRIEKAGSWQSLHLSFNPPTFYRNLVMVILVLRWLGRILLHLGPGLT